MGRRLLPLAERVDVTGGLVISMYVVILRRACVEIRHGVSDVKDAESTPDRGIGTGANAVAQATTGIGSTTRIENASGGACRPPLARTGI
jgi:hypothetical protein